MSKKDTDIAISVKDVSKSFKLPHEKQNSVKGMALNIFRGSRKYETQQVLNDISFDVKKGEFFGIVGRNGSGKSTLLKLISQIYTPDSGSIKVNGKLTPFIELGVGFNPELTGRENVFLNGALLGFTRPEMEDMYDEIVEFAELDRFMDQKLKNYSSGMQVRLAFSIAIRAETDILVLDEVLAVGDAAFQKKCFDYFEKLKKENKTVVLVTHDMSSVERFCSRAILIEYGDMKVEGKPGRVARQYTLDNMKPEGVSGKKNTKSNSNRQLDPSVKSLDIKLLSNKTLANDDVLEFKVEYEINEDIEVELGISVIRDSRSVIEHNTKDLKLRSVVGKRHELNYKYELDQLTPGLYEVTVAIFERKGFKLIGFNTDSCSFILTGEKKGGLLVRRGRWTAVND